MKKYLNEIINYMIFSLNHIYHLMKKYFKQTNLYIESFNEKWVNIRKKYYHHILKSIFLVIIYWFSIWLLTLLGNIWSGFWWLIILFYIGIFWIITWFVILLSITWLIFKINNYYHIAIMSICTILQLLSIIHILFLVIFWIFI